MALSDKNLVSLVAAEHIGPTETGDSIDAKRVALYDFDSGSATWQRKGVGSAEIRFDPDDSAPNYIGKNGTLNAATSLATWTIFKFTYSGANVTRIQKTSGIWDNRASLF